MESRTWLCFACAVGLVHAAFSLTWALGSSWMLATVGSWAVHWAESAPLAAALALLAVTALKAVVAVAPALARGRWRSPVRRLGLVCGAGLLIWGVLGFAGAALGLALGGDHPGVLAGHLLFDGLFAAWGAALLLGLRQTPPATEHVVRHERASAPED